MKTTISILGCGWLGFPLAQQLKQAGYQVKGSTTTPSKLSLLEESGIDAYLIDLEAAVLDENTLGDFLADCHSLIIAIPPRFKTAALSYDRQLERLLPPLRSQGVKRIFFMSSTSVYDCQSDWITEHTPTLTNSASARQLLRAEQLFRAETDWETTVLRLGGLFGPERHPVTFLCRKAAFENPDLPVNMVHLNDVVKHVSQLLLQRQSQRVVVYNVVAPYRQTRAAFYGEAARARGLQLPAATDTDWTLLKRVCGEALAKQTGLPYSS
ncbi:SDR family oxidoreductase [Flavobacterium sp. JP2137]|uniref:SDR family oxidoreductase n=1 Tax=Flavobacterium sp. JP2137 TaxID=3414510 RepID=UPI003D2FACC7